MDQSPIGEPIDELYWYSNHEIANETITINSNMNSVVYLRGSLVESYLESAGMTNSYCLVMNYDHENAKSQLRLRAVAINFNNLTLGRVEKLFELMFPIAQPMKVFVLEMRMASQTPIKLSTPQAVSAQVASARLTLSP